jgi:hypothetical protein
MLLIPLVFWSSLTLIFGRTVYEVSISGNYKIQISTGGIMSCGESIHVTKTKFIILDKEVHYESSLCIRGIEKITLMSSDESSYEFLIYHNGEMDFENPYPYKLGNRILQ